MRVAVTGASGKLGSAVVEDLTAHGHQVVVLDQTPPEDPSIGSRVDLTDYGQTVDALGGIDDRHGGLDAVVHLAALPAPGLATDVATFENNMLATYHVFHAALRVGIRNIVHASSETLLGIPFEQDPPYLPVDEDYPARPESTYSLVKHLEETMAEQLVRWTPGLKIVGLRFSNVMRVEDYAQFPEFDADPASRDWNLWAYIDRRDGAQAVRKALTWQHHGHATFVIANDDSVMSRSTAELAAARFPDVPVTKELGEHESLLSNAKAKRLLGFAPEHSWRDHV
ncbi:NAD-dependent epimerase/dehydratase family protein [Tersicoccus solisilvae]|uniref:NAD-dependent epimerase/dehydratase family protein n=1 Tax=Tersicoccus solisilvae TaxID=1882339 RepID=UPI0016662F09|nr:NAD(P)-dependent oxidoreductase [Tersicoccus solisilvae]